MAEYWLVSAPGDPSPQDTWNYFTEKTSSLSVNHKFAIPSELKVGTLDILVLLSDQLQKLDPFVEGVVRKIALYMADILEPEDKDKLHENLLVGQTKCTMENYVSRFQWDIAKFPLRQPLPGTVDGISKLVSQIDADLKLKSQTYNNLIQTLQNIDRKATGNLMARSLSELVRKEHFIHNSEYLETLLVVVPKNLYKDWESSYESLATMVVPRSTERVYEDSEFGLYTVTVFRKVTDEFKLHARENKFVVRDFEYDASAAAAESEEKGKLEKQLKKHFEPMKRLQIRRLGEELDTHGPLMKWLKVNFSQSFVAWVHLKALRVFTESVLRYSLPVNFQAVVMKPHRRSQKKLTETLNQMYGHLDSKYIASEATDCDVPGLSFGQQDYHPYVFFKLNLNLLEKH